jgi:hypothetical protein
VKRNLALLGVSIAIRQSYLASRQRVRQWGGLPAGRGPTVLITNHQHVNEGEIVIERIFLTQPWKPLVMVNSRRTFETGFFAARLPWTARFTRHLNPTAMWECYGILPVENHLFSRTLLSLAEEIRSDHGDLPIDAVLPPERVAALGLTGTNLSDLWKLEYFFKSQQTVKIAYLRDPYKREALEHFRTTSAADVARIVETVRAGATFYVTPEGDFSRDGRMHRLRNGIVDAVLPFAEPWLCAIAYDPFRGKRLNMLYRIVRPADPDDITSSLGAARPITTSALLSTVLLDRADADAISTDAATTAVADRLRALPSNVFVDPELQRDVGGCVADAIAGLLRLGTLRAAGDGFALTEHRTDARFSHIADMLAYQRAMLAETLECAARLAAGSLATATV